MVFDMHLNSLRNANVKSLWEDDVHPHYVMRRYAEFTASLIHLNVEYGDGQVIYMWKFERNYYLAIAVTLCMELMFLSGVMLLNVLAWTEHGKTSNGCWWLACQACKNIPQAKAADSVSNKQLWHDNCCIEGI